MAKEVKQKLLDSMTMCAFLCTGIDILHNWGVRSFYNYLFGKYDFIRTLRDFIRTFPFFFFTLITDENKDGELKALIVQDEHLKNQMKLLNEYLKSNGKKIVSKILCMKNIF